MESFKLRTRLMHFDPCVSDLVMGKAEVLVTVIFTPFGVIVEVPAADTLVNDGKERMFVLPIEAGVLSKDLHLLQNCLHPAAVRGIIIKARKQFVHLPENWCEDGLKMLVINEHKAISPGQLRLSKIHSNKESPTPPPVY